MRKMQMNRGYYTAISFFLLGKFKFQMIMFTIKKPKTGKEEDDNY